MTPLQNIALNRIKQIDTELARLDKQWDLYDETGQFLRRATVTREISILNTERAEQEAFLKLDDSEVVINNTPRMTTIFSNT